MIAAMTSKPFVLILLSACALSIATAAQTAPQPASDSPAAALVKQAQKLNSEGKQEDALSAYRKALQAAPNDFDAELGIGMVLDLQGKYADARQHLAKAIKVASPQQKGRALRTMAVSYAFEAKAAEASKYEEQAFNAALTAPDFQGAAGVANELARIDLESGDLDGAYKWYQKGYDTALRQSDLKEADKNLWLWRWENAQARIAARRSQSEEAQKHVAAAKAALDKADNPEQLRFYPYLTGYVAFYAGDYKTAIADLQKADQKDPFILVLLAQACEKSGDQALAQAYYHRVLESNAHNPTNAFARPLARKKLGA